jgi:hypothetical protein
MKTRTGIRRRSTGVRRELSGSLVVLLHQGQRQGQEQRHTSPSRRRSGLPLVASSTRVLPPNLAITCACPRNLRIPGIIHSLSQFSLLLHLPRSPFDIPSCSSVGSFFSSSESVRPTFLAGFSHCIVLSTSSIVSEGGRRFRIGHHANRVLDVELTRFTVI